MVRGPTGAPPHGSAASRDGSRWTSCLSRRGASADGGVTVRRDLPGGSAMDPLPIPTHVVREALIAEEEWSRQGVASRKHALCIAHTAGVRS
jgi:hypothetical protein